MKKILIKLAFVAIAIYFGYIMFSQQNALNTYKADEDYYASKIEEANKKKQELTEMKDNINSLEYIEAIAREKLGMYLPNERVYIDVAK